MLPQRARSFAAALLCWLLAMPGAASAANVEIRVSDQVSATADFRPGSPGKPAVLLLHGFLQTREFGIIKSLTDELASAGYTVLAPNLSLGISYRKSSLSCEALHLHDMDMDIREIQLWTKWLAARGYRKIVGLGHSFGAAQLLAWKQHHRPSGFTLIGISLVGSTPLAGAGSSASNPNQTGAASDLIKAPLSFCETYTAPAGKYASYYAWQDKKILAALKSTRNLSAIILGSNDKYLPKNWEKSLTGTGASVHVIKGANHFMEGTHEFEMYDIILGILKHE